MTRHPVSFSLFRFLLIGLVLCLIPILPTHADPDMLTAAAASGSISGRVTDVTTAAPLPNVTVEIPDSSIPKVITDADGRYRLTDVPDGKWYVGFASAGQRYDYEYYDDAPIMALATRIEVKDGAEVTGIDAALAPNGRITGRVTDTETGVPLGGVRAIARYLDYKTWYTAADGITDDGGRYAIEGVSTGIYRVEFVDERGDHATMQYGGGTDVGVLVGEETGGIDIALPQEGHIAGQVTDRLTGAPLVDAAVTLFGGSYFSDDPRATVHTDLQGRYDFGGVAAGEYRLRFAKDGYAVVFYHDSPEDYQATGVVVRAAETTGGIDQALTPLGRISGRVTDAMTGAPLVGIDVYLDGVGYSPEDKVLTAADGTYALAGVLPGEHKVLLRDPQAAYREAYAKGAGGSERIMVHPGRTTEGVDAALVPWAAGNRKITGTVTDAATGQPLAGIRVALYDCYYSHHIECWNVEVALTDAAGTYTFYDPGSHWGIYFSDPNGVYLEQQAANFPLPGPDETVVLDVALQRYDGVYGEITGKITARATGEPLGGLSVSVEGPAAPGHASTTTAPDGTYTLAWLRPGKYKVRFGWIGNIGQRYEGQFYGGGTNFDTAMEVEVRAGESTPNIDGALEENGRIAGTVRSATGEPLAGAQVILCNSASCDYTSTAADGAYLSRYLPPASYRVRAEAGGRQTRYYRDTVNWEQADLVTVTFATLTPGIDINLLSKGRIIGRVTDVETGAPIQGVRVSCGRQWSGVQTGADGRYDLSSLNDGACLLYFEDKDKRYAPWEATEPITLTVGQTVTFDVQLVGNGYIAGRVTAAENGEPLGGIEIRANYPYMTWTAPDGTYRIGPLPDGEYRVRFWDPGLLRRMEYYRETTDYNGYTRVAVQHGETTAGIDEAMDLLGRARGRVIDVGTGEPIAGVKVSGRGAWGANNPIYTDAEGRYDLPGLDDGLYSLSVRDSSHVYLDGNSETLTIQAGMIIDVPDVKLKKWGELGGTVTDAATGQPVPGVWVQLYLTDPYVYIIYGGYAITGPDGTYRIRGLYDDVYRPVFSDPQGRYHAQVYRDATSLLDATPVTFKRGAGPLGVDAALKRKGDGPPVDPPTQDCVYLPMVAAP